MMQKLACWIICRNDGYYIDMAIKSVLPNVAGIYILDNGSDDNTIDVIKSFHSDKIVLEQQRYDTPFADSEGDISAENHPYWRWDEQYDGNSLEAQTRNYAVQRCHDIFNPDWLLNLDADEVVTKTLFNRLNQLDLNIVTSIDHSTERFIDSQHIAREPGTWGYMRYDPHIRFWKATTPMKWLRQYKEYGHVRIIGPQEITDGNKFSPSKWSNEWIEHCRAYGEENRVFLYDILHIHLHRMFGPKSVNFFRVYGNNHAFKLKVDFNWEKELPFVLDKWKKWDGAKAAIL
ncbi:glycosyltransferase family 2 protein [bacterium]|nr:glycosyltransferase family 2 protein [bacterium]